MCHIVDTHTFAMHYVSQSEFTGREFKVAQKTAPTSLCEPTQKAFFQLQNEGMSARISQAHDGAAIGRRAFHAQGTLGMQAQQKFAYAILNSNIASVCFRLKLF